MKKLILSLIAVVAGTMSSFAQDDLIATLTHGSSLTTFTGATALSEAYTAAAEGDVITLSPGVFNAVDIEKAITVRGAGMVGLESNGYVSTQITGEMTINVPSSSSSVLTIEGIHALGTVSMNGDNLAPVNIIKCRFEDGVLTQGINMSAYASIFANFFTARHSKNTTLNCLNCIISYATAWGSTSSGTVGKIVATNCILCVYDGSASTYGGNVRSSVFTNCIITASGSTSGYALPNTCSAQNCLGIRQSSKNASNLFININNPTNIMAEGIGSDAFTPIFKSLTTLNEPSITETFKLTETAAATYLGNDGTQVGIYGGSYPFDPTPTNPQVKKFTVSNSTDGDKLKVKINVE